MITPGVHDGNLALPTSTTKTSKTARSELFISWRWRGWVLLHAGKAKPEPAILREPLIAHTIRDRELHLGAVIGVARLTDCHQDPHGSPPCTEWAQTDAWHLVLTDVKELALPIPVGGQLGPWKPTPDLLSQVLQQLPDLEVGAQRCGLLAQRASVVSALKPNAPDGC